MKLPSLTTVAAWSTLLAVAIIPLGATPLDPYEVTALLPVTGGGSIYAAAEQQSLKVVEDVTNSHGGIGGHPLKFVVVDDQSDPKVDVELMNQVIAKHPAVVLGPAFTSQCNAVIPLVTSGPTIYCFTPGPRPPVGGYVFAYDADTAHTLGMAMHYLHARGITRVATISTTDATGQDGDRSVAAATAAENVSVVAAEHFNATDISVAAQATRLKASNAQAIIVWTSGTPFATVLRSFQEVGLDLPVMTTNGNINYSQMKQYASFLPKELLFTGLVFLDPAHIDDKRVAAVVKTFTDGVVAQGGKPDVGNDNIYDGALLFAGALQKLGPQATATQVRDYIAGLKNWPGINGMYDFTKYPQRGLGNESVVIVRWNPVTASWTAVSKPGGAPI